MIDDMTLPPGKTCNQCAHWRRCKSLINSLTGNETTCDFAPSRFREKPPEAQQPTTSDQEAHERRSAAMCDPVSKGSRAHAKR